MTRYSTIDFGQGYLQVSFEDIPPDLKDEFHKLTVKARKEKGRSHYHDFPDGTRGGALWDEFNSDVRFWLWNKEYVGHSKKCTTAAKFAAGYSGKAEIFFGHRKPK